jgi:hypothetical protein
MLTARFCAHVFICNSLTAPERDRFDILARRFRLNDAESFAMHMHAFTNLNCGIGAAPASFIPS